MKSQESVRLSPIEGASQDFKQEVMIKWFYEELQCTLLHRFIPYLGVVICRSKDDGNDVPLLLQPSLQCQTGYPRHADVNDQADGLAIQIRFEEGFGRSKGYSLESSGLDQVAQ